MWTDVRWSSQLYDTRHPPLPPLSKSGSSQLGYPGMVEKFSPSHSWAAPGCRCYSSWSGLRTLLLSGVASGWRCPPVSRQFFNVSTWGKTLLGQSRARQPYQTLVSPQTSPSWAPPCCSRTRAPLTPEGETPCPSGN